MTAVHTSVEDSVWKKGVKEVIVILLCQNKRLLWWRGQKIFITWAVHATYPHSLLTLYLSLCSFPPSLSLLLFFRATFCTFTLTAPGSPRPSLPLLHISYSVFSPYHPSHTIRFLSRGEAGEHTFGFLKDWQNLCKNVTHPLPHTVNSLHCETSHMHTNHLQKHILS